MIARINVSKFWLFLNFSFLIIPFQEIPFYASGIQQTAGQFNPILAPTYLLLVLTYWMTHPKSFDVKHLLWMLAIIISVSLINLNFNVKTIRDIIYLSIFFILTNIIIVRYHDPYFRKSLVRILKFYLVVQLVVLVVFFNFLYDGERLALNSLSDTNSALAMFFMTFSYCILRLKHFKLVFLISTILIIISGSRAAFLIQLISFTIFLDVFVPNRKIRYFAGSFLLVITLVLVLVVLPKIYDVLMQFRVFSVEDTEAGSIASRFNWYMQMINELLQRPFGGRGAGSAEFIVGKIVHNDILRFWIDYSIAFLFVFLLSFLWIGAHYENSNVRSALSFVKSRFRSLALIFLTLVSLSLYNGYQDLILVTTYSMFVGTLISKGGE